MRQQAPQSSWSSCFSSNINADVSSLATPNVTPPDMCVDSSSKMISSRADVLGGVADFKASVNNSAFAELYICPPMPEPPVDIGPPEFVDLRCSFRMTLRPDRNKYVTLTFRVMRFDADMHVGFILNNSNVKRYMLYSPKVLDRWTRKLRIKIKSSVKVSAVFKSLSARLGIHNTVGIKYCLDGFYGLESFGDAFGNHGAGACPWMEVTGDGTALSLNLEDGDNIFISVPTEKMIETARKRIYQVSENAFKQNQHRATRISHGSVVSFRLDKQSENKREVDVARASMFEEEPQFIGE